MASEELDILVLGAGPAGCAVGTFLARAGRNVALLDAHRHPRHHIGESLLPASMPILNDLGISSESLAAQFQPKYGARFFDPPTGRLVTFGFEATPGSLSPSFQALREPFDLLLANSARAAGCRILEDATIESLDESANRPLVTLPSPDNRTLQCQFLIDATGRSSLIAARRREKRPLTGYGRLAIYNYFTGLAPHDDQDPHYVTMYLFPPGQSGWVWLIPLKDGRTSVGVVYRDPPDISETGPARTHALFWHAVRAIPRLETRLRDAHPTDAYRANADYSFTIDHTFSPSGGPRWMAIGDAAGFLDPIFSSGVHLALASAQHAAPAILESLQSGSARPLEAHAAHMAVGFKVFRAFVHRFYNRDLVQNLFFMPNKPPEIHAAVTRILAGHVWDKTNPVLQLLGQNA